MKRLSDADEESAVIEKGEGKNPLFVYVVAGLSAVGGLLFGYDTGVVSGAMILLRDYFSLDATMQGVVVSVTIITAWLTCLFAAALTDRYGRKVVILAASVVFTAGALLMGFSYNVAMLISGRVVVGIGIGLASMCVPMYIAEVSHQDVRGTLVTINNTAITLGQFIASLVDGAFSGDHEAGWRYMLGLAAVPSLIQLVGFIFMPESPRWLVSQGRYEEAAAVLRKVRGPTANVSLELDAIRENCIAVERERADDESGILRRVWRNRNLRTALLVGCSLQLIQQLAGINTVMYYSASIIEMSGVRSKSKVIWLSAATSGMNCLCSLIGLLLVERVGRRKLTLFSLLGVTVSLAVLAVSFQLADNHAPDLTYHDPSAAHTICDKYSSCRDCTYDPKCGYCFTNYGNGTLDGACLVVSAATQDASTGGSCNATVLPPETSWAKDWCPSGYTWMTFLGMLLYLFFFAPGMGPMPWTINSEIYPLWARSTCYSIATSVNWLSNFIVSLTFLDLMLAITKYGAFYLYTGLSLLGFVFLFLMLPETKGYSLEEVEGLFSRLWWRRDGTTSGADGEPRTVQSPPDQPDFPVQVEEKS